MFCTRLFPDLVLFCTGAGLNDSLDDVVPETVLQRRGFQNSHLPCVRVSRGQTFDADGITIMRFIMMS